MAASIDRVVWFAGWPDKLAAVLGGTNPVASSHFVFTIPEPTGVVALIAPEASALLGLVNYLCPIIVGGNTVIALASEKKPLSAITFSEVIATSDVPAGVINILTGYRSELLSQIAGHMDVNAVVYAGDNLEDRKTIQSQASLNVKRAIFSEKQSQSPYAILATQETKTTWHPIGL